MGVKAKVEKKVGSMAIFIKVTSINTMPSNKRMQSDKKDATHPFGR